MNVRSVLLLLILARAALATSAPAQFPARYLVFQVSRSGQVTLYSRSDVLLDARPTSDAIPVSGLSGARVSHVDESMTRERLVVDVARIHAGGRTLFHTNVDVDRFLRTEWADPITGEMHGQWIEQEEAAFVVRIPADGGDWLTVTHRPTGRISRFELAGFQPRMPIANAVQTPNADNSANRLDILLMGDGYTEAESSKFQTDAANLVTAFFSLAPYSDYRNYVNTTTLFTASNQSGADHPPCPNDPSRVPDPNEGKSVDTVFDATYCTSGLQRLLTVNSLKVLAAAAASPNADKIFVLVNDPLYGGSGGRFLSAR